MKLLVALLIFSAQAAMAEGLGNEVRVISRNEVPALGVTASPADEILYVTFSIRAADLAGGKEFREVAWRLYDQKTGRYLNEWQVERSDRRSTFDSEFGLNLVLAGQEAAAAIEALPHLRLVFSINNPETDLQPVGYVDIGSYCQTYPGSFTWTDREGHHGCVAP